MWSLSLVWTDVWGFGFFESWSFVYNWLWLLCKCSHSPVVFPFVLWQLSLQSLQVESFFPMYTKQSVSFLPFQNNYLDELKQLYRSKVRGCLYGRMLMGSWFLIKPCSLHVKTLVSKPLTQIAHSILLVDVNDSQRITIHKYFFCFRNSRSICSISFIIDNLRIHTNR